MILLKPNYSIIPLVFEEAKFYFQYLYVKKIIHSDTTFCIQRVIQDFFISNKPLLIEKQRLMVHTQKGQKQTAWTGSQNIYFICLHQGNASTKWDFK